MANKDFRSRLFEIIYLSDTDAGKWFDIGLILIILLSVLIVMLDSVAGLHSAYGDWFYVVEWSFTILFTIEYGLRIYAVKTPFRYIFSFFGLVDLLAIIPTYLALVISGAQYLMVIRALRILRIFRILKLTRFLGEADLLLKSILGARHKVLVFLFFMLTVVSIFGSLMFVIEGPENGFTSIPMGVYWAIVTVTTVGYGDIIPSTPLGQGLASMMVIIGYSIIAIPTGIFTAELSQQIKKSILKRGPECQVCNHRAAEADAEFCSHCGAELEHHVIEKRRDEAKH